MLDFLKYINRTLTPKKYLFQPDWIVLGVNNVCNLHCKMCDVGNKNLDSNFAQNLVGTHPINMPLDLIKKIIDDTATYFPKSKLAYAFTEPLVYPHLIESLYYANEKGLYTTITTNALTLKHKAEKIINAGIDEIFISLDGPQEIHNEIRGHKASFQKAIEGIQLLNSSGHCPKITVICAITEWNFNHLQQLIEDLKHFKISTIAFMHTQFISQDLVELHQKSEWKNSYPATEQSNMDIIDFSNLDTKLLFKEMKAIKNTNYPFEIYFSPKIETQELLDTYYMKPEIKIGKGCNAVYNSLMIKSDGTVIPAHGRCYNINIGNLYKQPLNEVWKSKTLQNLRADLKKAGGLFPACNRCCSAI